MDLKAEKKINVDKLDDYLNTTCTERTIAIKVALKKGYSIDKIHEMTKLDIWFIDQILQIVEIENELINMNNISFDLLLKAKKMAFQMNKLDN